MPRLTPVALLVGLLAVLVPAVVEARPADAKALALQARAVFKQHCHKCHHDPASKNGAFDVLRRGTLLAKSPTTDQPYITPGKPEESYVFERLKEGSMPPRAIKERPSDVDKDIVKQWIAAGAPDYPEDKNRPHLNQEAVLTVVRDHLRKADERDRPFLRFLTLTHLHNNPSVPLLDLRSYRAALSKAVNSLSRKATIVLPQALDKEQTVFVLDIRKLDWDRNNLWREILKAYPYGLKYGGTSNQALQNLEAEIEKLTGCELAYLRADWFVVAATRPPLYHTLLQLPRTAGQLEKQLEVDVRRNFDRDELGRAGFTESLVSGQNRLVERHGALHGAYWKSYDFQARNDRGILTRFPLGPAFTNHPFPNQAFTHDGGEIIFNLPNGLQGYLLVNGKDERIDEGPIGVVSDANKSSGTNVIVTGISCLACHKHGLIGFKDAIREGTGVQGEARQKVLRLYPEPQKMDQLVKEDSERFLTALEKTIGAFLKVEEDAQKPIRAFPDEPIYQIARLYQLVDLDLTMAALELDIEKPDKLRTLIESNQSLRELGLGPLLREGGTIKRHAWEEVGATSLMQRVARQVERGTPFRILK